MGHRTTVILNEDLLREAREATGIKRKTDLLHAGLQSLIRKQAAHELARMGGIDPTFKTPPRRRFRSTRQAGKGQP
jgi:hypothetical protein